MLMCICINCTFYKKCWIKKGLNKLPRVHTTTLMKLNSKVNAKNKNFRYNNVFLKIFLNVFKKKQEYEFDVIECEGFCENPGKWID